MEGLGLIIVITVAVVASISIVLIFVNNYKKAEPNEALIFTGRKNKAKTKDGAVVVKGWRAVVGGARLKIPVLEKINRISLKTMNLADVRVEKAYSKEGVPVTIDAVANVKISGEEGMLDRAVERFLGTESRQVQQIIKETLEGQLRDIIGVLTVEELYQKRDMFVNKVLEQAGEELAKIGVIIDIINIQDIRDERGYLEALGIKR
ncbi:MAG: SPFH domain-containing protein, partial [Planctomycetota bacterium]